MKQYILRVSLSVELDKNYKALKDKLINLGYTKLITDRNGNKHRLPNGNYLINSALDIDAIHKETTKTILTLDPKALILLVESKAARWHNI